MLTRSSKRSLRKAFTLLELIVVIVILGILAALAIPTFARVIERARQSTAEAAAEATGREAIALAAFRDGTLTAADLNEALGDTNGKVVGKTALSGSTAVVTVGTGSDAVDVTLTFTGNSVDGVAGRVAGSGGSGTTTPAPVVASGATIIPTGLVDKVFVGTANETFRGHVMGMLTPKAGENLYVQIANGGFTHRADATLTWSNWISVGPDPIDIGAWTKSFVAGAYGGPERYDTQFTMKVASASEGVGPSVGSVMRFDLTTAGVLSGSFDGKSITVAPYASTDSVTLSNLYAAQIHNNNPERISIIANQMAFTTTGSPQGRVAVRTGVNANGSDYIGTSTTPTAWGPVRYLALDQDLPFLLGAGPFETTPGQTYYATFQYKAVGASAWKTVVLSGKAEDATGNVTFSGDGAPKN